MWSLQLTVDKFIPQQLIEIFCFEVFIHQRAKQAASLEISLG